MSSPRSRNQWGHLYLYLVQTVIEVFTESSFANGFLDVDISGCYYADVGLAYLSGTHGDVLAVLQYTQQSGLCGHRQFADLVEKECSLVGSAEIAL